MAEFNGGNIDKKVLLRVEADTSKSTPELESLQKSIETTRKTALKLSKTDYSNMSVKDLKTHLDIAETSMTSLKDSGLGTEETFRQIRGRVDEINKSLNQVKTDKAYETLRGQIRGATGAVLGMEGAMSALGLESKSFEQTVQTIIG